VRPLAVALVALAVVVGALSVAGTLAVVAVGAVAAAILPVVAARLALDGFSRLPR
jgi:hypothetical protein